MILADLNSREETPEPGWNDDCDCIHPAAVMAARVAIAEAAPAEDVARMFAILGDPTRLRVLVALGSSELCVSDLAVSTGINRSTVSHQLAVLREHRLVQNRREGKVVYYALDDDHVMSLLDIASEHVGEAETRPQEVSA